jgi:hypothetical protein
MILRIFLGGLLAVSVVRAQSPSPDNQDQAALIALENEWLANLHNPAVLEKILASDFVHPLPTGDFVTKAQHIQFSSTHLPPPIGNSGSIRCRCGFMAMSASLTVLF